MKSIINLMTVIGGQGTLIITHGQSTAHYLEIATGAATFVLPNDVLQRCSGRETEQLQTAIERSGCSQLIFFALLDEKMESKLQYSSALYAIRQDLQFKTRWLPASCDLMHSRTAIRATMQKYVVAQCERLMQYHFIQTRVRQRSLTVCGMIGVPHEPTPTTVFRNGVRFNDHISMN